MASPVVLDAGPLVAILNRDDEFHFWAVAQLGEIRGEIITCEAVIAETYFLIRHVSGAVAVLLNLLEAGAVKLRFDLAANLTLDSDFKLYRRHGRQTIPLIYPAP